MRCRWLRVELRPGGSQRIWEAPLEQAEVPGLPWYLGAEEPAEETMRELWRKQRPLQGEDG